MIDFLFKFNVLNTAFSVIGKEIAAKLSSIGGSWFHVLYVWILYAVYNDWRDGDLPFNQIASIVVLCFVINNAYITSFMLMKNVSFINFPVCTFLESMVLKLMKITFPYILWRYVFLPANMVFTQYIAYVYGPCSVWYCTWGCYILALLVTGIVVSYCSQNPAEVIAVSTKRKYSRRTPVAKRTRSATKEKQTRSTSRR